MTNVGAGGTEHQKGLEGASQFGGQKGLKRCQYVQWGGMEGPKSEACLNFCMH